MNSSDDDSTFARLFFAGLFFVTVISALPHLIPEDRRAGTFLAENKDQRNVPTKEKSPEPENYEERFLPPGPTTEQIHDFLYPPAPREKLEARVN
jgi:hypothetical protein